MPHLRETWEELQRTWMIREIIREEINRNRDTNVKSCGKKWLRVGGIYQAQSEMGDFIYNE